VQVVNVELANVLEQVTGQTAQVLFKWRSDGWRMFPERFPVIIHHH
jgi:hypothetical protein